MSLGWKRLWANTKVIGLDSYQLVSAMIQSVPRTVPAIRDVIVQQAKRSNTVAVSILQVDREVGLLRYWGLSGYLRQKHVGLQHWDFLTQRRWLYHQPSSSTITSTTATTTTAAAATAASTTEEDSNATTKTTTKSSVAAAIPPPTTTTTTTTTPSMARIAFMVTAAMRQELTKRLDYSEEQIKRLTPLQASLVLQYNVPSQQVSSKLPELEQQHFQMQQAANHSAIVSSISTASSTASATTQKEQGEEAKQQHQLQSYEVAEEEEEEASAHPEEKEISEGSGEHKTDDKGQEDALLTNSETTTATTGFATDSLTEPGIVAATAATTALPPKQVAAAVTPGLQRMIKYVPVEKSTISYIDMIDDEADAEASPDKIWFELIEKEANDGTTTVAGLYRDLNEAHLALETRELFEKRRAKDKKRLVTISFDITRVLK